MEDKKYELVLETVTKFYSKSMYRIRALKDFSDVKKGQFGGYVESEENLSQLGNCWIYDDSIVGLGSRVIHNAVVKSSSTVIGYSEIKDSAVIDDSSHIDNSSIISGQSKVIRSFITNGSAVALKSVVRNSLVEQSSMVIDSAIGPDVHIKNGADIRFNVNDNGDYVVYKAPMSYCRSLTASTKQDIWSSSPHADTAEKLRVFLIEDEVLEESDEYLRWYDSIVAFHKNYFNIK